MLNNLEFLNISIDRIIELLDRDKPKWYKSINIELLDMTSAKFCILGQIYGHYIVGLNILRSELCKIEHAVIALSFSKSKKIWINVIHKKIENEKNVVY